ncbi:MAG: hypothetical protein R2747_11695 [Pyrinomonadaceae bacterium]
MRAIFILTIILAAVFSIFGQPDENLKKLVETEKSFARTAAEKSVRAAFLEFLADSGVVFQPTEINGKEFWRARRETAALLAWNPVWADISSDGQIGYTTGDWDFRPKGKDDNPVAYGQYITVWRKQPDGNFRAVLDIGISHEKPASVETEWRSPEKTAAREKGGGAKKSPDLKASGAEDLLAEDVRLYRPEKLPFIGKKAALDELQKERKEIKSVRILAEKCDGAEDFRYCYGEIERTGKDGRISKENLMQIWKLRDGKWRLALEVRAAIPSE